MLRRQMAHHGVVDLQHAGDLVERLAARLEHEQVVDALLLLRDLVGEPAAAPGVVAAPRPSGPSRRAARTRAIRSSWRSSASSGSSIRRISYVVTSPDTSSLTASHGLNRPRLPAPLGTNGAMTGQEAAATVASGSVKRLFAWVAGAAGGLAAYRALRGSARGARDRQPTRAPRS